jgi:hypothetical protein
MRAYFHRYRQRPKSGTEGFYTTALTGIALDNVHILFTEKNPHAMPEFVASKGCTTRCMFSRSGVCSGARNAVCIYASKRARTALKNFILKSV